MSREERMHEAQVAVECSSSTHSVTIFWTKAVHANLVGYDIKYKIKKADSRFESLRTNINSTNATIEDLDADTEYLIKVYSEKRDGDSSFLIEYTCKTKPLTDIYLQKNSTKLENGLVYKVNYIKPEKRWHNDEIRELQMVSECKPLGVKDYSSGEKTILILGATGSGKTTIVDALFNFVADVSFKDGYLYRLVDLNKVEENLSKSQVQSQTSGVTVYRIPKTNGFRIDYRLNIIDTPGFDDTRGKDFDKNITQLIKTVFTDVIEHLEAVCIVLPLNAVRLTDAQIYVFNSILELFGENIRNNIIPFITFYDGGTVTHCLESMKAANIPFRQSFEFNNSDIATPPATKLNWDQRTKRFSDFF